MLGLRAKPLISVPSVLIVSVGILKHRVTEDTEFGERQLEGVSPCGRFTIADSSGLMLASTFDASCWPLRALCASVLIVSVGILKDRVTEDTEFGERQLEGVSPCGRFTIADSSGLMLASISMPHTGLSVPSMPLCLSQAWVFLKHRVTEDMEFDIQ